MAGTFNTGYRSESVAVDEVFENLANNTFIDTGGDSYVTDYTGRGVLCQWGIYAASCDATDLYLGVQIDGGSEDTHTGAGTTTPFAQVASTRVCYKGHIEFASSLKVRAKHTQGGAQDAQAACMYAHQSTEAERVIIPANSPLPSRDYTVPNDMMVIMYASGSTRLISKPQDFVDYRKTLKVLKKDFNLQVGGELFVNLQSNYTGKKYITIDNKEYELDVTNGNIDTATVPSIIGVDDFWDRFTSNEEDGMDDSNDSDIKKLIKKTAKRQKINLKSGWVLAAMDRALQTSIIDQAAYERIMGI